MSGKKCPRCGTDGCTTIHPYADEFTVGCCHGCGYVFKVKEGIDTPDLIVWLIAVGIVLAALRAILYN